MTGSAVGLQLGAGNIVNNAGAISGSSAGIAALDNSTIINSGQISATGASGTALSARGTITNTGTISGTSGISALGGAYRFLYLFFCKIGQLGGGGQRVRLENIRWLEA